MCSFVLRRPDRDKKAVKILKRNKVNVHVHISGLMLALFYRKAAFGRNAMFRAVFGPRQRYKTRSS